MLNKRKISILTSIIVAIGMLIQVSVYATQVTNDPVNKEGSTATFTDSKLSLEQTVNNENPSPGDKITYTFKIKNTGNTDLNTKNITIIDEDLDNLGISVFYLNYADEIDPNIGILKPDDEYMLKTSEYIVKSEDAGKTIKSTAYVVDTVNNVKSNESSIDFTVKAENKVASLSLEQTVSNENPSPGDRIIYTFIVKNTGNTDIDAKNISIIDEALDNLGVSIVYPNLDKLSPGEEYTITSDEYIVKSEDAGKTIKSTAYVVDTVNNVKSSESSIDFTVKAENKVASLSLEQTVSNENPSPGDRIICTFIVKNTGNTDIDAKNISVIDETLDNLGVSIVYPNLDKLSPGQEYTITSDEYIVKSEDAGKTIKSTAYVVDTVNNVKSNESSIAFTVKAENKVLSLSLKNIVSNENPSPGDKIIYTFIVKNTGNTDIDAKNISIIDPSLDNLGVSIVYPNLDKLSPGEEYTITSSEYIVKSEDAGKTIKNTTYAVDGRSNVKSNESSIAFTVKTSGIFVTKNVDKAEAILGDTLTYTIKVENNGQTDLKDITVKDDLVANTLMPSEKFDLKSGESKILKATYVVKEGDKLVTNVVLAIGKDLNGNDITSNSPSVETKIKNQSLKILKSVKKTAVRGETIKYTFVVTNTGDTTIKNVTINDDKIDKSTLNPQSIDSLAPGAEATFTANYTIPESVKVSDKIKNTATATGQGINNTTVISGPSSAECTIVEPTGPGISISKSVDNANPRTGDTVTYTLTVKNIGNTYLKNIDVSDDALGYTSTIDKLSKGESKAINLSRKVTETSGSFTNKAIAKVKSGPSAEATATYCVVKQGLSLLKTVNNTTPIIGESLTYKFNVTNTGNVTIKNITINDTMIYKLSLSPQSVLSLEPGESALFTATYTVPNNMKAGDIILNSATATGNGANNEIITSNKASVTSTIVANPTKPGFSIFKTVDKTDPKKGNTVIYTITVKNTGNIPISNIKITDEALNYTKTIDSLDVGKYAKLQITKKVTEDGGKTFTNTAKAKADGYDEICSSISYTVVKPSSGKSYLPTTGEKKYFFKIATDK